MKAKNLLMMTLFLFLGIGLMAQEKYEQGVIMQSGNIVAISIEGKEFQVVKLSKQEVGAVGVDFSAVLNQIAKLRIEGWEVWNSNSTWNSTGGINSITYFLRRKLKQ